MAHGAVEMALGNIPIPDNELFNREVKTKEEVINEEVNTNKSEMIEDEVLGQMFNKDNLSMMTDLSPQLVVHSSRARIMADRYNCSVLDAFVDKLHEHLVSKGRKGRGEAVEVIQNVHNEPELMPTLGEAIWKQK